MATALYDKGREGFALGDIDWVSDDIRAILVDSASYTFSQTHDFLDDIPSGARKAVTVALVGKTATNGICSHTVGTFTAVAAGAACEAIVYYRHTGVEATSALIAYVDNYTGLPVTPNGTDIAFTPLATGNKLFKL